jgi:hypothetical protein
MRTDHMHGIDSGHTPDVGAGEPAFKSANR